MAMAGPAAMCLVHCTIKGRQPAADESEETGSARVRLRHLRTLMITMTPTNAKSKAEGFWRQFWNYLGTSMCLATARHQSTDGQAERAIAQLTQMMRIGIDYQ